MTAVATDWRARTLAVLLCLCGGAACAARGAVFVPPASGGVPAAEAAAIVQAAQQACGAVRTMTAQASLSGRLAGQRVRGRLDLGLTREGGVRLEAIAPFGLLFVLAGDRDGATLLLTREERVVRDQPAGDIVEAIAGIRLAPQTLLAITAGCPGEDAPIANGQRFPDGLVQVSAGSDRTVWLRPEGGAPRIVAARVGDVLVEYPAAFSGSVPRTIRLRKEGAEGRAAVDLQLAFSQIELNGAIDPAAFSVTVPSDAKPLSLDELRRSGLLSGR